MARRPLNVVLRPRSPALAAFALDAGISAEAIAAGFEPRPDLDMTFRGGRTVADLRYVNCFLGGEISWTGEDRANIDSALERALADPELENVMAQYFSTPTSVKPLASRFDETPLGDRFYKNEAEGLVSRLHGAGILGDADPASTAICLFLPRGVVLVDANSDGTDEALQAAAVQVEGAAADSKHGLGGYHGSVHVGDQVVLYAVGVYSEGDNGIVAFDESWKNVVATFYHELNEVRTDPDVEEAIRTGEDKWLGWYSDGGGEVGDIPMLLASDDLSNVMVEVELPDGGTVPVQLQWSNAVHGPEGPIAAPH